MCGHERNLQVSAPVRIRRQTTQKRVLALGTAVAYAGGVSTNALRILYLVFISTLLSACAAPTGAETSEFEGDASIGSQQEALTPSIPGAAGPIVALCPGAPPPCRCASARAVCVGTTWTCRYPTETCNGVDDDCNGRVDDGGNALCNDGMECTDDACSTFWWRDINGQPTRQITACINTPQNTRCNDGASCTNDVCRPASAGRDARGCVAVPRDNLCDDGCNCTGREVCSPGSGANATTGCRSGAAPCERDGNVCTINACCEGLSDACRRVLGSRASEVEAACAFAGGDTVRSETGANVRCPGLSVPLNCDDGNPCTSEFCSARTGCGRTNVRDGTVISTESEGCVVKVCMAGRLTERWADAATARSTGLPTPTCGSTGPFAGTCFQHMCRTFTRTDRSAGWACLPKPNPCSDGLFCNGEETCWIDGATPTYRMADGSMPQRGCKPAARTACDDSNVCTNDTCSASARTCSHSPSTYCELF